MRTISEEEQAWNMKVRTENLRCPACGEYVRYEDRQIFEDRRLCSYCADMIPGDK